MAETKRTSREVDGGNEPGEWSLDDDETMSEVVSVAELADILMLSERRIHQLAKEGVIQRVIRGRYLLGRSVQGYVLYLREKVEGTGTGSSLDVARERARLLKAQADRAEAENRQREDELVKVAEVKRVMAQDYAMVRSRILAIPNRLAATSDGGGYGRGGA